MTAEDLRDFVRREPFEPFTIHMNDGSRLKVTQPDNLFAPRQWNFTAIVALESGRWTEIAIRNVAHVTTRGRWPRPGQRRRRNGSSDA